MYNVQALHACEFIKENTKYGKFGVNKPAHKKKLTRKECQEVRQYFLSRDGAGSKWPPVHKV